MDSLNVQFNNMEQLQKDIERKSNQLEAELKILYYTLININKKVGGIDKWQY